MTNDDARSAESADRAGNERGWGGAEVVRDHEGQPTGGTRWDGDRVVRDEDEHEAPADAGWSASEVVRDHGETGGAESGGGWSAQEVVKDQGEPAAER
jgi:hypothetical protein